jgi:hypothetical protein
LPTTQVAASKVSETNSFSSRHARGVHGNDAAIVTARQSAFTAFAAFAFLHHTAGTAVPRPALASGNAAFVMWTVRR